MKLLTSPERKMVLFGAMAFAFSGFLCLLSLLHPGAWAGTAPSRSEHLDLLEEAFQAIRDNYVTVPDDEELVYDAIRGMMNRLDLYSTFYDTREATRFTEETEGAYGGLGVGIIRYEDALTVQYLFDESPLLGSSVEGGDRIISVNGESIFPLASEGAMQDVVEQIRGPEGTRVTVGIETRATGEKKELEVDRVGVDTTSVHGVRLLSEDSLAGYIWLESFQNNSTEDFDEAIEKLTSLGMKALILDLRQNTGGVLRVAVDLADRFLDENLLITETKGRTAGSDRQFRSREPASISADIPVVLLVDSRSASASEIVSGAIKDHRRGLLIGTRTFGKGLVQSVLPLGSGDAILKVTSGRYFTPGGRCIQSQMDEKGRPIQETGGISPDFYVELTSEEFLLTEKVRFLTRMESHAGGREIFAPEDIDGGVSSIRKEVEGFIDPQIALALDILLGKEVHSRIPAGVEESKTASAASAPTGLPATEVEQKKDEKEEGS